MHCFFLSFSFLNCSICLEFLYFQQLACDVCQLNKRFKEMPIRGSFSGTEEDITLICVDITWGSRCATGDSTATACYKLSHIGQPREVKSRLFSIEVQYNWHVFLLVIKKLLPEYFKETSKYYQPGYSISTKFL